MRIPTPNIKRAINNDEYLRAREVFERIFMNKLFCLNFYVTSSRSDGVLAQLQK